MERTTLGSWLRTTQAFGQQLCEKETLDHGIAFFHPRFASLPEACQFREVLISGTANVAEAFAAAEAWFSGKKLCCLRWSPAEGQPVAPLAEVLIPRGFRRRDWTVMALTRRVELPPSEGIRILPARAMRAAFCETFRDDTNLLADAYLERLDDPQLEMFVAVSDQGAVGRGGLFQVGDIARIVEPRVLPGSPAGDVERALFAMVLGLARRLTLRIVLIQVEREDAATKDRLTRFGFADAGEFVEFDRNV